MVPTGEGLIVRNISHLTFPNYSSSINYWEYESALAAGEYSANANYREYNQRLDAPNYTKTVNAG